MSDQLALDGFGELEPGSLFGPKVANAPTPATAKPRYFRDDGQECCPACGGPFHRSRPDRGGYCERCGRMRVTASRLVK